MGDRTFTLPPGFRFHPTDEELVVHFLHRKAELLPLHPDFIPDLDLYPYDPWDLDGKAVAEGKKWYFYSRRTQSRVTGSGYWQTVGADEQICSSRGQRIIGMKKYYTFYLGEPSQGVKTNWVMEEYRLPDSSSSSNRSSQRRSQKTDYSRWVVCRVYEISNDEDGDGDDVKELSYLDEVFLSLDDLEEISFPN